MLVCWYIKISPKCNMQTLHRNWVEVCLYNYVKFSISNLKLNKFYKQKSFQQNEKITNLLHWQGPRRMSYLVLNVKGFKIELCLRRKTLKSRT